MYNIWNR